MVWFLQVNLNNCQVAQDLFFRALSKYLVDVAIISEPQRQVISMDWLEDTTGKAQFGAISGFAYFGDIKQADEFVVAEVMKIHIYRCYFSPNQPLSNFEAFLDKLLISIRRRRG